MAANSASWGGDREYEEDGCEELLHVKKIGISREIPPPNLHQMGVSSVKIAEVINNGWLSR